MKKFILFNLILLCSLYVQGQSQLLEQYRAMALDYSHDLHAAEKNIAASMEVERSARADLKPKLSADANFQYTGNPMELNIDLPSMSAPLTFQGRDLKYGASLTLLQPEDNCSSPSVWHATANHLPTDKLMCFVLLFVIRQIFNIGIP